MQPSLKNKHVEVTYEASYVAKYFPVYDSSSSAPHDRTHRTKIIESNLTEWPAKIPGNRGNPELFTRDKTRQNSRSDAIGETFCPVFRNRVDVFRPDCARAEP